MIDINIIRERPDYVKEALKKKLWETDFTELLSWDKEYKELLKSVENKKAEMNALSASVPAAKKAGYCVRLYTPDAGEQPSHVRPASHVRRAAREAHHVAPRRHKVHLVQLTHQLRRALSCALEYGWGWRD